MIVARSVASRLLNRGSCSFSHCGTAIGCAIAWTQRIRQLFLVLYDTVAFL
jgi:hypothetical protein